MTDPREAARLAIELRDVMAGPSTLPTQQKLLYMVPGQVSCAKALRMTVEVRVKRERIDVFILGKRKHDADKL